MALFRVSVITAFLAVGTSQVDARALHRAEGRESSAVRSEAGARLLARSRASTKNTALNAGIFRQPPVYRAPSAPTSQAVALRERMRTSSSLSKLLRTDIPTFFAYDRSMVLPTVASDGVVYGWTRLKLEVDGTFSVINTPMIEQGLPLTAANYREGTLVLASMMFEGRRYTNVTLQLNAVGRFELVAAYEPLPVAATSYENAKSIRIDDPSFPDAVAAGIALTPETAGWFQGGSGAFADFFQDGSFAVVAQQTAWRSAADRDRMAPNAPAIIRFMRKNAQGRWVDDTARLLTDTTGCISPRKAVVADFNGDRKPDVFYACHGFDGAPDIPDRPPFGDHQRLLLSRVDGRYDNLQLPFVGYGHGASAADLTGDGLPDVVVTNTICQSGHATCNANAVTDQVPYVLINEGAGRFRIDRTRLPVAVDNRFESLQYWGIYELELIDTRGDGKPDLFVGGSPAEVARGCTACAKNGVLRNDGNGFFNRSPMIEFPLSTASSGRTLGNALDFVQIGNFVYFHQDVPGATSPELVVQQVDLRDYSVRPIWSKAGLFSNGAIWPTWLYPTSDGRIRSRELNCSFPIQPASSCGFSIGVAP